MFSGLSEKEGMRQVVKGRKRAIIDPEWRIFLQGR